MTTISKNQNRVTHDGKKYRFVNGGLCLRCQLGKRLHGRCRGLFPCYDGNGRTDGKTGNFQEVANG